MTIYATSIVVNGTLQGPSISANNVSGSNGTPLNITGDVSVNGSVLTKGRLEFSDTMFLTMRPTSDLPMNGNERIIIGDDMVVDNNTSDATSLSQLADVPNIWDWTTGTFTIPVDGLYNLELQGSFSNVQADAQNGVYWYMRNQAYPEARMAANISRGPLVSSSITRFLLKGDVIQPAFYSSDPESRLLANGETFVSSLIMNTVNVDHSKYYRI
jgi:hypothetical protein